MTKTFLIQYFKLRLKVLYRNLELGMLFWFLPILILGVIIYGLTNYQRFIHEKQIELFAFNVVVLVLIHNKRKDTVFIKNTLTAIQLKTIYFLEYFLVSSPFIILAIGSLNSTHLLLLPILLSFSYFSLSVKSKTKPISIFKKWNIEWNSGFRIYAIAPISVIIFYISSFFLPTTSYLNIFLLGLILLSLSAFLAIEEEPSFIRIFNCSPQQFLSQKIKTILRPLLIISIIASTPLLFIEQEYWFIIVLIVVQGLIYNINTLIGNYANYQNEPGKFITFFIKLTFTLVPFLLPLNLILSVFLYRKAVTELNTYLHAVD